MPGDRAPLDPVSCADLSAVLTARNGFATTVDDTPLPDCHLPDDLLTCTDLFDFLAKNGFMTDGIDTTLLECHLPDHDED